MKKKMVSVTLVLVLVLLISPVISSDRALASMAFLEIEITEGGAVEMQHWEWHEVEDGVFEDFFHDHSFHNGPSVTSIGFPPWPTDFTLSTYPNSGWQFDGWFSEGRLVSSSAVLNYIPLGLTWHYVGSSDIAHIQARFSQIQTGRVFGPEYNAEPGSTYVYAGGVLTPIRTYRIGGSTFAGLRDLAVALAETEQRFSISYDSATGIVSLFTQESIDGEIALPSTEPTIAIRADTLILLDGVSIAMTIYRIDGSIFVPIGRFSEEIGLHLAHDVTAGTFTLTADMSDMPDMPDEPTYEQPMDLYDAETPQEEDADTNNSPLTTIIIIIVIAVVIAIGVCAAIYLKKKKAPPSGRANVIQSSRIQPAVQSPPIAPQSPPAAPVCASCKFPLKPDTKFCGRCGKSV